jgi:WD40 repeat protein
MSSRFGRLFLIASIAAITLQPAYGEELPPGAVARLGTRAFRHAGRINAVAFSPDGTILATGGDRGVRFWDAATGTELHTLIPHQESVVAIAFSRDGKYLASGGGLGGPDHGEVNVSDVAAGKLLVQLPGPLASVWSLTFSPSGDVVLLGNERGEIQCHDLISGEELQRLPAHSGALRALTYTSDGKAVAAISDDKFALWNPEAGKVHRVLGDRAVPGYDGSYGLAAADQCPLLAIGCWRSPVQVWDGTTGRVRQTFAGFRECIYGVALSPDGRLVAAGGGDAEVFLWDVNTGEELQRFDGHLAEVQGLAFSPDGRTLAAAAGGAVRLWDVSSGRERLASPGHQTAVTCAVFSRDGSRIVTAGGHAAFIWERTGAKLPLMLPTGEYEMERAAFSPDGKTVAAWGRGMPYFWDTGSGKKLSRVPTLEKTSLAEVAVSPDLTRLTWRSRQSGLFNATLHLWDTTTDTELQTLDVPATGYKGFDPVHACFSPDGKIVATANGMCPDYVQLWNSATGKELGACRPKSFLAVPQVAFSPDGSLLAAAGRTGQIELWDVTSRSHTGELRDHKVQLTCLAFSPDGRTIAAGDVAGIVRLWELDTGAVRRYLRGHRGTVRSVAFSPDGRSLATGSTDTTVLVWDLTGHATPGSTPPGHDSRDLDGYWADLAGTDAARAYRALWSLVIASQQSLPFLRTRVNGLGIVEPHIERLITGLDDEEYAVRERAARALERLGEAAEPALRRAVKGSSPEQRRAAAELLAKMDAASLSPVRMRARRLMEALQVQGSADARQLIEAAARWSPEPWVMHEASAVLSRTAR